MPRLVFNPTIQRQFIEQTLLASQLSSDTLAAKIGVCGRTLRDWRREKFLGDQDKLTQLSQLTNTPLPTPTEIREDWWSAYKQARVGGLRRQAIYGCTLTQTE